MNNDVVFLNHGTWVRDEQYSWVKGTAVGDQALRTEIDMLNEIARLRAELKVSRDDNDDLRNVIDDIQHALRGVSVYAARQEGGHV